MSEGVTLVLRLVRRLVLRRETSIYATLENSLSRRQFNHTKRLHGTSRLRVLMA
jgi:hypothetical protein